MFEFIKALCRTCLPKNRSPFTINLHYKTIMKLSPLLSLIICSLLLSSCSHHRDVRPGVNGVHRVKVQASDKGFASRSALRQAKHFCKERNQYSAIISENVTYVGSMSEATYNNLRTASNAATVAGLGTGAYALASGKSKKSKTAKIAAVATAGGVLGKTLVSDGYVAEMTFQCQ